jgi:hypothetical protein
MDPSELVVVTLDVCCRSLLVSRLMSLLQEIYEVVFR